MSTEIEKDYDILMRKICSSEPLAYKWFMSMVDAVMTWDHIIDSDDIDKDRANDAFMGVMLEWPVNPWFLKYREILVPIMANCLSAWQHSNSNKGFKLKDYDFMTEIPCAIAFIIGGQNAVMEYGPEIRRLAYLRYNEDEKEDL